MVEFKDLQKKNLPDVTVDFRKPDWKQEHHVVYRDVDGRSIDDELAPANALNNLETLNPEFINETLEELDVHQSFKLILKRYAKDEYLNHYKVLYNELSEPSGFHLFKEDGMHAVGFSYFEKSWFSSSKKNFSIVLPEIGIEGITQGQVDSAKAPLAFGRFMADMILAGMAAKIKNPGLEQVQIYAHSVINPFLKEQLPKLGFKKIGEREVKNKSGNLIEMGDDLILTLKFE